MTALVTNKNLEFNLNEIMVFQVLDDHADLEYGEESIPCRHYCKITLSDGRERDGELNGVEIFAFLNKLPTEKVIVASPHHFAVWNDYRSLEGIPHAPPNLLAVLDRVFFPLRRSG